MWRSLGPCKDIAITYCQTLLEDATGSIMFPTVSPEYFISVTWTQCKLVLNCEETRVSVVDLQLLLTTGVWWKVYWSMLCHPHGGCFWQVAQKYNLYTLETLLVDTINLQRLVWKCHHGRGGLPLQPEWSQVLSHTTSSDKTRNKISWIRKEQNLINHSLFGRLVFASPVRLLSISFAPKKVNYVK